MWRPWSNGRASDLESNGPGSILSQATYVVSLSKAPHTHCLVLVNHLGRLSLPRKTCIRPRKGFDINGTYIQIGLFRKMSHLPGIHTWFTTIMRGVRGPVVERRIWNQTVPGSILGQATYVVSLSKAPHTHCLVLVNRLGRLSLPRKHV